MGIGNWAYIIIKMAEKFKKRFKKEIELTKKDLLDIAEILNIDEENLSLTIGLKGPKYTKYVGNIYKVNFNCSKGYPFKQPKIVFKTPYDLLFLDDDSEVPFISTFLGNEYNPIVKLKDILFLWILMEITKL